MKLDSYSSRGYRSEIDGLRAVAVLSVCLFHADFPGVGGGFVGVDVFFVISGYLITGIIQSALNAGTFSIADFYARRARRILPALFVVLAATAALGYFLMLPGELKMLGRHIAATALFVSNIVIFRESGYFDLSAELKPLLMTWSLGVEEQFYIVWPLLLWLAARWRVKAWIPVGLLLLLSLSGASLAVRDHPAGTFFLLPSRAWELALGAFLALRPGVFGKCAGWFHELAGALGLLAILVAVFGYGPTTVFPAYGAVLPCVGAGLVLLAAERSKSNVLLLSNRPMRWVGRISYSLYLWHWPLFAFARLLLNGELPLPVASALLLLSFVLAQLSWQLIEQPWRHAGSSVQKTLRAYGLCLLVTVLVALAMIGASKSAWRTGPEVFRIDAFRQDVNPLQRRCHLDDAALPEAPDAECQLGKGQVVFLWGDSHADALSPGVAEWAATQGYGFTQFSKSGCPPLPNLVVNDSRGGSYDNCRRFNQRALAYVLAQPEIEIVVLDARWSIYSEARHGVERSKPDTVVARPGEGFVSAAESRAYLAAELEAVVDELRASGKRIVLVTQPPDPGFNVPQCWARRSMLGEWMAGLVSCDLERASAWARIEPANAIVRSVAAGRAGVGIVDAASWLCHDTRCVTKDSFSDEILYFDDDHLSRSGAHLLMLERMVLPSSLANTGKDRN